MRIKKSRIEGYLDVLVTEIMLKEKRSSELYIKLKELRNLGYELKQYEKIYEQIREEELKNY